MMARGDFEAVGLLDELPGVDLARVAVRLSFACKRSGLTANVTRRASSLCVRAGGWPVAGCVVALLLSPLLPYRRGLEDDDLASDVMTIGMWACVCV